MKMCVYSYICIIIFYIGFDHVMVHTTVSLLTVVAAIIVEVTHCLIRNAFVVFAFAVSFGTGIRL